MRRALRALANAKKRSRPRRLTFRHRAKALGLTAHALRHRSHPVPRRERHDPHVWHGSCLLTFARAEQCRCHRMAWLNFHLWIWLSLCCGRSCGQASWRHGTSRAEQPPPSATPRFPTARGGMGKRGLAIQLSQGQGRQPLSPEGAPRAARARDVRASRR
jgi:hypothetical protein